MAACSSCRNCSCFMRSNSRSAPLFDLAIRGVAYDEAAIATNAKLLNNVMSATVCNCCKSIDVCYRQKSSDQQEYGMTRKETRRKSKRIEKREPAHFFIICIYSLSICLFWAIVVAVSAGNVIHNRSSRKGRKTQKGTCLV